MRKNKDLKVIEKEVMKFKVVLIPDEEVGGYNVVCPALKGCRSQGDTIEEALENIKDAIKLYLKTADELAKKENNGFDATQTFQVCVPDPYKLGRQIL